MSQTCLTLDYVSRSMSQTCLTLVLVSILMPCPRHSLTLALKM
ncbi:hypothetical protein F383_22457 [Gossypium arboreum]|uniref:Uncharacterized protein n=1 Tax=Gossypium arboreum TaxID=29729 RepID=A0A0B0NVM5_GOSAR|nr:hypothetical protein F383_22457 [Gossypium arboreum]